MPRYPVKETNYSCFYPWSYSFGHYPNCVARGDFLLHHDSIFMTAGNSEWSHVLVSKSARQLNFGANSLPNNNHHLQIKYYVLGFEGISCHSSGLKFNCKLFQCTLMVSLKKIQKDQTINKGQRCSAEVPNWTLCSPLQCINFTNRKGTTVAERRCSQESTRPTAEDTAFPQAT